MSKKILFSFFIIFNLFTQMDANCQMSFSACSKQPVYKDNGGKRKTNFLNRGKVKREAFYLEACRLIASLQTVIVTNKVDKSSAIDTAIVNAINASNKRLDQISDLVAKIDIKDTKEYEKLLVLLQEVRDIKCKMVDPITKYLYKKTNRLYSDVAFSTGSSQISRRGALEVERLVSIIENDIQEWRTYVSECNERVFEKDLFVLVVDISGYADQRGGEASNLVLSESRAKAVKLELIKQLNALVRNKGVIVVFDKIRTKGFGEVVPPGVQPQSVDDPNRRICLVSSLVGPSKLLSTN
jgi:outer membrane protein OmpA-like peptidoglycan-associated protein